ncbi:MAG: RnfH family protein [Lautropia sp.]
MIAVETVIQRDGDAPLARACHRVPAGTTIRTLLQAAGERGAIARIEARMLGLAVFGRRAWLDDPLADGDRVEVVAGIVADIRSARSARVAAARARQRAALARKRRAAESS